MGPGKILGPEKKLGLGLGPVRSGSGSGLGLGLGMGLFWVWVWVLEIIWIPEKKLVPAKFWVP